MEQHRLLIFIALCFVGYLLYDAWMQEKYPVSKSPSKQTSQNVPAETAKKDAAAKHDGKEMPLPSIKSPATVSKQTAANTNEATALGEEIIVETDVLRLRLQTMGGDIREADLLKYPEHFNKKDAPFKLFDDSAQRFFVAQSGWYPSDKDVPYTDSVYRSAKTRYELPENEKQLQVDLVWQNSTGVEFTKRYIFERGSYTVKVEHRINNPTERPIESNVFLRLQRNAPLTSNSIFMLPTYVGAVYYSPDQKYKKVSFSDIDGIKPPAGSSEKNFIRDAINREFNGGWAAFIEQFFVGAWLPESNDNYRYFTAKAGDNNNRYMLGLMTTQTVAPKQEAISSSRLYIGPKLQNDLEAIAPGLELSVDYGWLTFLAKPLFWVLDFINSFVHNWGWSIILLTILIKLVFYKLSETSYRSMANMKRVAPRMMQLKERYGADKQKLNQALMELYKTEKINPLGGCLPILIQIPVFIALYYVLIESVELRQAPWILWIEDLSIMDPYFVLPIIMGATMFIQHKLNPAPLDPLQAKIMLILPLAFTIMFAVFPSGLVLYWVVNNALSIAQQWYITKHVLDEEKQTSGHHAEKK